MLNDTAIHRLAQAGNALRPDWPIKSLITLIGGKLAGRSPQDVAVAIAWIATDPETTTPGRIVQPGPWWLSLDQRPSGTPLPHADRCPNHPAYGKFSCPECARARKLPDAEITARCDELRAIARGTRSTALDGARS